MISDIVRALVAAGASPEMILGAVEAAERAQTVKEQEQAAKEEERLSKQRERTRRWREHTQSVTSRDVTQHHVIHRPPPKDKNQTPTVSELCSDNTPIPKTTPRIELEAVLDPEHAAAVIDHRQRLASGLTAHAAKLLAAEFAKCADPNAAADTMISRGWRGFKPKWLEERPTSTGPPRKLRGSAALSELASRPVSEVFGNTFDEPSVHPNGNFAARNGR